MCACDYRTKYECDNVPCFCDIFYARNWRNDKKAHTAVFGTCCFLCAYSHFVRALQNEKIVCFSKSLGKPTRRGFSTYSIALWTWKRRAFWSWDFQFSAEISFLAICRIWLYIFRYWRRMWAFWLSLSYVHLCDFGFSSLQNWTQCKR